ncbi:MAG: aspartate-semialdehyde dehydrogenase, partial [Bacteroidales bacterium]|nr:aspartate-semialdehyde dehydrogenase [Bacteroidales bacterium]
MKLAVVGATGLVGGVILKVLEEGRYLKNTDIHQFIPVASQASVGKEIAFNTTTYKVMGITEAIAM